MKNVLLMILMVSAFCGKAQNETYYAKQLQKEVGSEFEPIKGAELFKKIVLLDSGIQITTGNGKIVLIKHSEVNKVRLEEGQFRYEFNFDIMDVALFFLHLPYEEEEPPKLAFAMLKIPEKGVRNEGKAEYYRIAFQDLFVINK